MNLAPTYAFGYTQLRSKNFTRVVRDYQEGGSDPPGYKSETRYKLDTRFDHIVKHDLYKDREWFKPMTSLAPNWGHQKKYITKGGEEYWTGKLGVDLPGGGTELGIWVNGATDSDYLDPGAYFRNIFNSQGAGAKYKTFYANGNVDDQKYHSWTWEVLAGEPQPWPFGVDELEEGEKGLPGIEFTLQSIDLETGTQLIDKAAFRDWQINFIHLAFEHAKTGELKSIEVYPQPGSKNFDNYIFRRDFTPGKDRPTHKMGQLPNTDDFLRLKCTPEGTAKNKIDKDWLFWGFSVSAWIGIAGGQARWRSYNFADLRPVFDNTTYLNDDYK